MASNQFSYSRIRENKIFRSLVVIMCICYLLQPINKPVSAIFHSIYHLVEMPDQFLDSSSTSIIGAALQHDHKHQIDKEEHQHEIIDFFASVFSANESAHNTNLTITDLHEVEEHLITQLIGQNLPQQTILQPNRVESSKTLTGHTISLLRPPIA